MENTNLIKKFGSRVQALRKKAGLTQHDLAERADITVEQISKIERGLSGTRIETADTIATALNVELHELFVFGQPQPLINTEIEKVMSSISAQDRRTKEFLLNQLKQFLQFLGNTADSK